MPPEYTSNLNLAKPDLDDQYNVAIWNNNMQLIDDYAGRIPPRALTADKFTTGANINGVLFKGDRDVVTGWGWYYSTVVYPENAIVYTVVGNEVKVKRSLQDNNVGHTLADANWWADVELGGSGSSALTVEDIGTIKFSLSPIRNDNLHLLDGELITEIPVDFLDYITWLRTNAPNCFLSEADYQSQLSLYGECGNFVYDTTYNTVRLPKITGIIQGTNTLSALGKIIQAGLPSISHTHTRGNMNITGTFSGVGQYYYNSSHNMGATLTGAFYRVNSANQPSEGVYIENSFGNSARDDYFGFNAASSWTGSTSTNSNVSSIYGNSNTVQPQTVQGFYYIVYTNLGINQNSFIEIIDNKADKSYVDNQMAIVDQTYATKEEIAKVYDFKGNVATYNDLPDVEYEKVGNVYNVLDTDKNYAVAIDNLNVKFWDSIGGSIDLSNYYTKQQVYNTGEIDAKLLEITTGEADVISQVAGIVDGKFEFSDGLDTTERMNTTVSITSSNENLTVTSSYTGSQSTQGTLTYEFTYNGENWLLNEQVVDLSTFYLTVTGTPVENDTITLIYTTLKITSVNVDVINSYSPNSTKPINGMGVSAALTTLTIPEITDTYSSSSTDGMSGVAVASAISTKEDKKIAINVLTTSGTIALTDNSINSIAPTGTITFTLPTITDNTVFHQILVQINMATAVSINLGTTYYFGKTAPDMSEAGVYNLIFEYDKANSYWVCGVIDKGAVS